MRKLRHGLPSMISYIKRLIKVRLRLMKAQQQKKPYMYSNHKARLVRGWMEESDYEFFANEGDR